MTLNQFIENNKRAVKANFAARNTVVTSLERMVLIKAQRRKTIRRFISQIRASTNQNTSKIVEEKVAWVI